MTVGTLINVLLTTFLQRESFTLVNLLRQIQSDLQSLLIPRFKEITTTEQDVSSDFGECYYISVLVVVNFYDFLYWQNCLQFKSQTIDLIIIFYLTV